MNDHELPAAARSKLAQLRGPISALRAEANSRVEALRELDSHTALANRLMLALDPKTQAAEVQRHEQDIAFLGQERERLLQQLTAVQSKGQLVAQLVNQLEHWLAQQPREPGFAAVATAEAAPKPGETLKSAISRTRQEIQAMYTKRRTVLYAPLPAEDLKAVAREFVKECGRVDVSINVQVAEHRFYGRPEASTFVMPVASGFAVAAWLEPEKVIAKLEAGIDEDLKQAPHASISKAEKEARLKELDAAALELERDEESLVEQSIAAGETVTRRFDANPLAVLCIAAMDTSAFSIAAE